MFIPFGTDQNYCRSSAFCPCVAMAKVNWSLGFFELKLAELFISFKPYPDAFELSLCWRAFFFHGISIPLPPKSLL